jgi:hypothetical protein
MLSLRDRDLRLDIGYGPGSRFSGHHHPHDFTTGRRKAVDLRRRCGHILSGGLVMD